MSTTSLSLAFLQPLIPTLSAILLALIADVLLRLLPQARDRLDPLLGVPARLARRLEDKLNRRERAAATRASRGVISLVIILAAGFLLGAILTFLSKINIQVIPLVFWFCFRVTFPWTACAEVLKAQKNKTHTGEIVLARRRVPVAVPTKNPDRHAVARMLIEASALSLHRGLLAPVLWALFAVSFGISPVLIAVIVTFLLEAERVIVTPDNQGTPFAAPFEMVEAVINFVPARVAGLFWTLGAVFTPNAHPGKAFTGMFRHSEAHRAVNTGWPVAAVAGALNVALAGGKKQNEWIGPKGATAKVGEGNLQRMVWLHAVTLGMTVLIFTATLLLAIAA